MKQPLYLGPNDIILERPLTHPSHTFADFYVLRYIVDQLNLARSQCLRQPEVIHQSELDGRPLRLVILQPEFLNKMQELSVVGFFGYKKADVSFEHLNQLDKQLVNQLPKHSGLLSYCTLQLHNDSSANLVLFANPEAKAGWGTSDIHSQAIQLAPDYYTFVRIYNGHLPKGINESSSLYVTLARYFDYQSNSLWTAVRQVSG